MSWSVGLSNSARRDLDRLPPRVLPAVLEFIYGPLAQNPCRVGKPLRGEFTGQWSAHRADYRVLYSLDEDQDRVVATRVGHRAHVYRP